MSLWFISTVAFFLRVWEGRSYDGGRIGLGDHSLPHKFIKRSLECWATATKQLLNAGGGHQAPREAAHSSLGKEVGQNIKDKKRDKRVKDGDPSWGGSRDGGEVFKHQETPSPIGLRWNKGKKERKKKENLQIMCLAVTPSREVAWTHASSSSGDWIGRHGLHA